MLFLLLMVSCLKSYAYKEKPTMLGAVVGESPFVGLLDAGSATIAKELGITEAFKPLITILLSPISLPTRFFSSKIENWFKFKLEKMEKKFKQKILGEEENDFLGDLERGNLSEIKKLVSKEGFNVNKKVFLQGVETSFLHIAIRGCSSDIANSLIDAGADCDY